MINQIRCGVHQKWYWTIMTDQTRCRLWQKPDRTITWPIVQVWSTPKNNTELLWLIELGVDCDENHIEEIYDWLYRYGLCQKWNWAIVIDQTMYVLWWKPNRTMMWSIVWVWSMVKSKLNCQGLSNQVWYVMKTRVDNEVSDYTCAIYDENDNELSWPTKLV